MRLHCCHFPSVLLAKISPIKRRRYIVLADSSRSPLPPLRNPKPLPPPPPPSPLPPPSPSPALPLLQKPSPLQFPASPAADDAMPPFVNLFRTLTQSNSVQEGYGHGYGYSYGQKGNGSVKESGEVMVEYYDPRPGDLVVGVVLSGNENKLDVSIGSDMLGSMLTKEALPFCREEMNGLVYDLSEEREKGLDKGRLGIVRDGEGFREKGEEGRKVVEAGTVVFAEVFGRSLGGRPLLSCRRHFRRIAWHRVRQVLFFIRLYIYLKYIFMANSATNQMKYGPFDPHYRMFVNKSIKYN